MRNNLQQARKVKSMTQQAVADYLNISVGYYKKIEYGTMLGAIDLWDKLEDLFEKNQRLLREVTTN